MSDVCPMCGAGHIEFSEGTINYSEGGLINAELHGAIIGKCDTCGESFEGIPDIERLQRAIVEWLAAKPERLTPGEIKYIRKAAFGLSGKDLAAKLSVTPESISRWENGSGDPMSVTMEKFLRSLALSEKPVAEYPLNEMASEAASHAPLTASMDAGTWRIRAA